MITNRTENDVILAKTLILKVKNNNVLTANEETQLSRGICDLTMIKRILDKQFELKTSLNSLLYTVKELYPYYTLTYTDILSAEQYNALFSNTSKLRDAFYVKSTTPQTPTYLFDWKKANDFEQILVDIEDTITDMISRYRQCGSFQCGEVNTN